MNYFTSKMNLSKISTPNITSVGCVILADIVANTKIDLLEMQIGNV